MHKLITLSTGLSSKVPTAGRWTRKAVRREYWCRLPETCRGSDSWEYARGTAHSFRRRHLEASSFVLVKGRDLELWGTRGEVKEVQDRVSY